MVDEYDDGQTPEGENGLTHSNLKKIPKRQVAVAVESNGKDAQTPKITAAGRGKIAEQILQLAFENDIKVREDSDLAEILATIEIDSPVPTEVFPAVAEILSYVYRANGHKDPFDSIFNDESDLVNKDPNDE